MDGPEERERERETGSGGLRDVTSPHCLNSAPWVPNVPCSDNLPGTHRRVTSSGLSLWKGLKRGENGVTGSGLKWRENGETGSGLKRREIMDIYPLNLNL